MAPWVFVNIGSGNGLLPYGTKPLPEPMVTYQQYGHEDNFPVGNTEVVDH